MLQIASGKLFKQKPGRCNELRGVALTNLTILGPIETAAGRLLPASTLGTTKSLVYEIKELIEGPIDRGVVVSHGIDPYLNDFAAIVSFALNVTCTPDHELSVRLVGGRTGPAVHVPPSKLIRRVFDPLVVCNDEDAARLTQMVGDLMGLRRKSYLAAIRAIRTYITGLHRLADDWTLAYTLLVASLESLAQGFDGHHPEWQDYDERRRHLIDDALCGANNEIANRVRQALLEIEHVSLRRRFCDYALEHLQPSYFREEASDQDNPAGRAELPGALRHAYKLRSKYIHNLKEIPRQLTLFGLYRETFRVGSDTLLTFQGLSRLARHVITEFIRRQPKVDREEYDYSLERTGIVQVTAAPQYWIHRCDNLTVQSGRMRLEGFIEQVTAYFQQEPDAVVTDISEMLARVEKMLPGMSPAHRLPFVALYLVFNALTHPDRRMKNYERIKRRYEPVLESPSVEALLVCLVLGVVPGWPLVEHQDVHDAYFRDQDKKSGIKLPRPLEAGLCLLMAERYRLAGDPTQACDLVVLAVENYPGHAPLHEFERNLVPGMPIDWRRIIFPEPRASDAV